LFRSAPNIYFLEFWVLGPDDDDSITFNRVTKESNNFQKKQNSKKKAQKIIQGYMKEHKFEIQEIIKERKICQNEEIVFFMKLGSSRLLDWLG